MHMQPLKWKMDVPIFKNQLIVRQLALSIGLPFAIPAVIIFILAWRTNNFQDAKYAFGIVGLAFVLAGLLVLLVYRGKYSVEFRLDQKGVISRTQTEQARANSIMQKLLVILGFFSRNPTAMGIGLLAQARQSTYIPWSRISKVRYHPKQHTIIVKGGWTESIAIFCPESSYESVKEIICTYVNPSG